MTGYSGKYTLRLLPPLIITRKECDEFIIAFREVMENLLRTGQSQVKEVQNGKCVSVKEKLC